MSKVGLFTAGLSKPAPFTVSVFRVFSCYKGIKGAFQALLLAIRVYTLCGFISHHVGEPTKCWWTTDTDVSGEAMGMQQTVCPW